MDYLLTPKLLTFTIQSKIQETQTCPWSTKWWIYIAYIIISVLEAIAVETEEDWGGMAAASVEETFIEVYTYKPTPGTILTGQQLPGESELERTLHICDFAALTKKDILT